MRAARVRGAGWSFVAFPLAVLFLFTALPTAAGVALSLFEWGSEATPRFVGLQHYADAVRDPMLRHTLRNTLIFAGLSVPLTVLLAFPVAVALHATWFVGRTALRTLYFLPTVISIVAIGLIWRWVLAPGENGLLNHVLRAVPLLGLDAAEAMPDWLGNSPLGLLTLIIVSTWRNLGFAVVLYLSALGSVSQAQYDAAAVDGATPWQAMWRITWPTVRPMTIFLLITGMIGALQVFDIVWVMIGPHHRSWTDVLNVYLYREFINARPGYAAMIGVVVLGATAAVTAAQLWWLRERGEGAA